MAARRATISGQRGPPSSGHPRIPYLEVEVDGVRVRGYPAGVPCWTQLRTPDPAASAGFYAALFDWSVGSDDVFRSADRATAGLVAAPGQPAAWLVYVATDDAEASGALAVSAGGRELVPAQDSTPGGRSALLADPSGAVFGVWQRRTFGGTQVTGEPGAPCWIDLATTDTTGVEAFYGKLFGWTPRASQYGEDAGDGGYVEFNVGERAVAGLRTLPPELAGSVAAHWLVTFDIDGHADAVERAVSRGAQLLHGPIDVGVGPYAQLLDPHGAAFGLIELAPELRQLP